ncbi:intraflagellar transport protein 25 homolog isoform X4 [Macaca mulatta]
MRKIDLCLSSEGSEVILATSSDEKHPPENIIDGNPETFWTTTGMFPQEFIICFHKHIWYTQRGSFKMKKLWHVMAPLLT